MTQRKVTKIYLKILYQPKIRAIPNLKERGFDSTQIDAHILVHDIARQAMVNGL